MSKFLRYEPCPKCREIGRDNKGDNLAVYSDGSMHCFSCRHHVFPNVFTRRVVKEENVPKTLLPSDFTREVPTHALKWLLQWQLPWSYWKNTIGFSAKENRLIFLVGDGPQFSIGRYVGDDTTKRKWYVWGDCHKHAEIIGTGEITVVVEDLISAHKLGQITRAMPIFGTTLHTPHKYFLQQQRQPVVLWLDNDQRHNTPKIAANLSSLLNVPVHCLSTEHDPKSYSIGQLNETLRSVCLESVLSQWRNG